MLKCISWDQLQEIKRGVKMSKKLHINNTDRISDYRNKFRSWWSRKLKYWRNLPLPCSGWNKWCKYVERIEENWKDGLIRFQFGWNKLLSIITGAASDEYNALQSHWHHSLRYIKSLIVLTLGSTVWTLFKGWIMSTFSVLCYPVKAEAL
jgi:hypothetical protein